MRKRRKLGESIDTVNIKPREEGNNDRWDVTTITDRVWIMHPGLMARAVLVLLMAAASLQSLKICQFPT
jgi:hypothetical protein